MQPVGVLFENGRGQGLGYKEQATVKKGDGAMGPGGGWCEKIPEVGTVGWDQKGGGGKAGRGQRAAVPGTENKLGFQSGEETTNGASRKAHNKQLRRVSNNSKKP